MEAGDDDVRPSQRWDRNANRYVRGLARGDRERPLNEWDGHIPNFRGVRVHMSTGYNRVEGNSAGVAKRPRERPPTRAKPLQSDSQLHGGRFEGRGLSTSRVSPPGPTYLRY